MANYGLTPIQAIPLITPPSPQSLLTPVAAASSLPPNYDKIVLIAEKIQKEHEEKEERRKKKEEELKKKSDLDSFMKVVREQSAIEFERRWSEFKHEADNKQAQAQPHQGLPTLPQPTPPSIAFPTATPPTAKSYNSLMELLRKDYSAGRRNGKWPNGSYSMLSARAVSEGVLTHDQVKKAAKMSSLAELYCKSKADSIGVLPFGSLPAVEEPAREEGEASSDE
jgi:hypothetical protein